MPWVYYDKPELVIPPDGRPDRHRAIPESELGEYEWIEEGKPYREWLAPAELINAKGTVVACSEEEEYHFERQRWVDWQED